jgi:hypothetical protein
MESRRIHERIIAVRDAIGSKSNGRASAELAERSADMPGTHPAFGAKPLPSKIFYRAEGDVLSS